MMSKIQSGVQILREKGLFEFLKQVMRFFIDKWRYSLYNPKVYFSPALHSRSDINQIVSSIYEEVNDPPTVTILDIGARNATHITGRFSALHNCGDLHIIGIEPDSEECSRLQKEYPQYEF